jgi:hypothetical protein
VDCHQRGPGRAALDRTDVADQIAALLGMDDADAKRERRLAAARRELAGMELRWRLEDEAWEA